MRHHRLKVGITGALILLVVMLGTKPVSALNDCSFVDKSLGLVKICDTIRINNGTIGTTNCTNAVDCFMVRFCAETGQGWNVINPSVFLNCSFAVRPPLPGISIGRVRPIDPAFPIPTLKGPLDTDPICDLGRWHGCDPGCDCAIDPTCCPYSPIFDPHPTDSVGAAFGNLAGFPTNPNCPLCPWFGFSGPGVKVAPGQATTLLLNITLDPAIVQSLTGAEVRRRLNGGWLGVAATSSTGALDPSNTQTQAIVLVSMPTLSEWGGMALAGLLLLGGLFYVWRRRSPADSA